MAFLPDSTRGSWNYSEPPTRRRSRGVPASKPAGTRSSAPAFLYKALQGWRDSHPGDVACQPCTISGERHLATPLAATGATAANNPWRRSQWPRNSFLAFLRSCSARLLPQSRLLRSREPVRQPATRRQPATSKSAAQHISKRAAPISLTLCLVALRPARPTARKAQPELPLRPGDGSKRRARTGASMTMRVRISAARCRRLRPSKPARHGSARTIRRRAPLWASTESATLAREASCDR